jgi:hypothetical protein
MRPKFLRIFLRPVKLLLGLVLIAAAPVVAMLAPQS